MYRWVAVTLTLLIVAAFAAPSRASAASGAGGVVSLFAAPAPEGGDKHDDDIFGKSLDLAIWTWVVFLLLFIILRKFAWGPILEGLKKREETIHAAVEEARQAREESRKMREQLQAEMNKAAEKVREMLDEARRDGEHTKAVKLAEAEAQIKTERDRSLREIQIARDQAMQELRNQSAELAAMISAKALRRSVDADLHRSLVDEAVAELAGAATRRGI